MKPLLITLVALLFFFNLVSFAFANPLLMDSLWEGKPIQYLSIIFAEFCGLLAGTSVLLYKDEGRWRKAILIVLTALAISYGTGVAIWSWGYSLGILMHNPINPFLNASTHPLGSMLLLLPEFIGTVEGSILIHWYQKVSWRKAVVTMAVAMLASFLAGLWIANIYLRAL